jgi:uncharacterized repeat protein (TIGR03803 family)
VPETAEIATAPRWPFQREEDYREEKTMRIVSRGMAITLAALSLTASAVAAPVETVLYSFKGSPEDGNFPAAGLIADAQGALYGTTVLGGSHYAYGTVFKLTPPAKGQTGWTESVLHSFGGSPSDGAAPYAGLIFDAQGALYGTTYGGGSVGGGTVFKLTPPAMGQSGWKEIVLRSFGGSPSDGAGPKAGLIFDAQGALYGTTQYGGSGSEGTVFKLMPPATDQSGWKEIVLHSFTGGIDGSSPTGGLIFDAQGALYGTTLQNGSNGNVGGNGTVFKLTPPAEGQTVWTPATLYSFCSLPNCTDGFAPVDGLIFDKQGALYGTTGSTVFKLTPPAKGQTGWIETVLYSLGSSAGLIFDAQGALYGTTYGGGNGTGFKLTPPATGQIGWKEIVLHSFSGSPSDGANPYYGGLIADTQGALYGTTYFGGSGGCSIGGHNGCGTVFKLAP